MKGSLESVTRSIVDESRSDVSSGRILGVRPLEEFPVFTDILTSHAVKASPRACP